MRPEGDSDSSEKPSPETRPSNRPGFFFRQRDISGAKSELSPNLSEQFN